MTLQFSIVPFPVKLPAIPPKSISVPELLRLVIVGLSRVRFLTVPPAIQ